MKISRKYSCLVSLALGFLLAAGLHCFAADSQPVIPMHSLNPPVLLPDGTEFKTWEASARYSRTYYVDNRHPRASDRNPGSKDRPFATINRAAQVLKPGERVVVAAGVYRERIAPARGGDGPDRMIGYEAAPGAEVIVKGSRVFLEPWTHVETGAANGDRKIWQARLNPKYFAGYNPFDIENVTEEQFDAMSWAHPQRGKVPFILPRGLVFQDGLRLTQVAKPGDLAQKPGTFFVDRTNRVLQARFFADVDPASVLVEITTQETVFAPEQMGLGFIRVQGFTFEQVGGPFPFQQVGAISTTRGHHWIIEDNVVRQVNGAGMDVGVQFFRWPQPPAVGFHIVRRNTITDCGIVGICGLGPGRGREFGLLLEDNTMMRNAWHDVERLYETGGIKTHNNVRCLIRRNLVADTFFGAGIWMDWDNRNSRCCQNLILNSRTLHGGIFVEASTVPNLVDHNLVWGTTGPGIYEHDSTRQIFAHNLIGKSSAGALRLRGKVTDRKVGGQEMTYGAHEVRNNLFVANAQPDEYRGEPSVITNNITVPGGIRLEADTLELIFEKGFSAMHVQSVPATGVDYFGNASFTGVFAPGPFATLPKGPTRMKLWPGFAAYADDPALGRRLEWFQDLKFGFMMHWGAYSQWGCIESWPLVEVDKWARPDDLPAWVERDKDIARFKRDYWELPKTFNPGRFDPAAWAGLAKAAGMKYLVFTTKHHDGFAMFDTALSDYRITSPDCPFNANARSNVVREVFNAFRREGLSIGAYFSKADWRHPDYWSPDAPAPTRNPNYDTLKQPEKWRRFVDYTYGQTEELMTDYGPVDILWLDAGQVRPPQPDLQMDRLAAMARRHQPGLIMVDRTVHGRYENYRTPEQEVPEQPLPYVWETCMTMGDQWSFKPGDQYKSTHRLVHLLVDIVAKGGNFLLNVGPTPDGELPAEAVARMKEIGAWMKVNGEAIYGTRPIAPYKEGPVAFTRKGSTVYAIYLAEKAGDGLPETIRFSMLKPMPRSKVQLLGSSRALKWQTSAAGETIIEIPDSLRRSPPCRHAFAVRFQMADQQQ